MFCWGWRIQSFLFFILMLKDLDNIYWASLTSLAQPILKRPSSIKTLLDPICFQNLQCCRQEGSFFPKRTQLSQLPFRSLSEAASTVAHPSAMQKKWQQFEEPWSHCFPYSPSISRVCCIENVLLIHFLPFSIYLKVLQTASISLDLSLKF